MEVLGEDLEPILARVLRSIHRQGRYSEPRFHPSTVVDLSSGDHLRVTRLPLRPLAFEKGRSESF
jgi:hypothetical protein